MASLLLLLPAQAVLAMSLQDWVVVHLGPRGLKHCHLLLADAYLWVDNQILQYLDCADWEKRLAFMLLGGFRESQMKVRSWRKWVCSHRNHDYSCLLNYLHHRFQIAIASIAPSLATLIASIATLPSAIEAFKPCSRVGENIAMKNNGDLSCCSPVQTKSRAVTPRLHLAIT